MTFILDAKLEAGSAFVADLALSQLRLLNDARFVWLLLVPRVESASELFDLSGAQAQTLMTEIREVSATLKQMTGCTKVNVAALGNKVRQLHVHVIARHETDAAWPGAVWDKGTAVKYAEVEMHTLVARLRNK